jgi:serine/threonine-protein kinase RsbW
VQPRSIHIESRTDRLVLVREFVSEAARQLGFVDAEVSKIALAVDEACTNIIKHGYGSDPSHRITITVQSTSEEFVVVIQDSGRQFDPSRVSRPDMNEYLSHYRRGGLGVHLMRSLMDNVEYHTRPGRLNEVRLVKSLPR